MAKIDLVGQRFSYLTVVREAGRHRTKGSIFWECVCDCGNVTVVHSPVLRRGSSKSCGCMRGALQVATQGTHGATSNRTVTSEFAIWSSMKARCYNPSNHAFANYGGRGIAVCATWYYSFNAFVADMGLRPGKEYSLDRIDVNGSYSPDNCRWATAAEQANNKRTNVYVSYEGVTMTASQLSRKSGVHIATLLQRLGNGWSVAQAANTAVDKRRAGRPRKQGWGG